MKKQLISMKRKGMKGLRKVVSLPRKVYWTVSSLVMTLMAAGMVGMEAYAAEGNVNGTLNNLVKSSTNFFDIIGSYSWVLGAAALIAVGILYIVGGEEGKQRANKWVPRIIIGTVIMMCAASLAQLIAKQVDGGKVQGVA